MKFISSQKTENCSPEQIKTAIDQSKAERVIAVGGDGTLKLVADLLKGTKTPIGIIPAGSANGMAKELGIPLNMNEALTLTINGETKEIHAVIVNGEFCIHLSDIGFNAYIVKKFDDLPQRGMWGYTKALWKALWSHHKMEVEFNIGNETIRSEAAMVVIANATMYGTGVKINPDGKIMMMTSLKLFLSRNTPFWRLLKSVLPTFLLIRKKLNPFRLKTCASKPGTKHIFR
ncbi:diacylglycerol/lipid kinase family protein [Pedobacter sp. NJ-S-72]